MMDHFLSLFFGKMNEDSSRHHHHHHHHHHQDAGCVSGVVVCGDVTNGVIEMEEDDVEILAAVAASPAAALTTAATGGGSGLGANSATGGHDGGGVEVTEAVLEESSLSSSSSPSIRRKRGRCSRRRTSAGRFSSNNSSPPSATTPVLVPLPDIDQSDRQPSKRLRGVHGQGVAVFHGSSDDDDEATESSSDSIPLLVSGEPTAAAVVEVEEKAAQSSPTLTGLPEDVVAHCLSFLGGLPDRFALQCTGKQFQRISNSDEMLLGIQVGGDKQTGLHGIISEKDTPETASDALVPFVNAGNLEAIYMLGIIKSYCQQDIEGGIWLLKMASGQGFYRASYALGLVLRDSHPDEAAVYMKNAADAGFIPALQELLPARQMKAKYGEPKADELRLHLDPLCLNRLLSRHYVKSAELRGLNTSHCWNPLCGRWAFKATVNATGQAVNNRPTAPRLHHPAMQIRRVVSHSSSSLSNNNNNINNSSTTNESDMSSDSSSSSPPQQLDVRVSRMKMCSRCCRAKYCSKLCQVYDWRSGRHKMECQFL